jgi:hypothetical protein
MMASAFRQMMRDDHNWLLGVRLFVGAEHFAGVHVAAPLSESV